MRPTNVTSTMVSRNPASENFPLVSSALSPIPFTPNRSLSLQFKGERICDESVQRQLEQRIDLLKHNINSQSKLNFLLESDIRDLDSRIALLIANRMALDEFDYPQVEKNECRCHILDDKRLQLYSILFHILVTEPRHIATLCSLVSLTEMDMFLQTVMFTIYANQYDEYEEHLLLTVFQFVLSTQFKTSHDFSTVLRANTPISRMMSTYTRRGAGQTYLKNVLSRHVHTVLQTPTSLDLDPAHVLHELVREGAINGNPECVTLDHPMVQERIEARSSFLMHIANAVVNDIITSVDLVPYGIRWICKQIKSLTRKKDPDACADVIFSLIGSFFFLRYVNVAIVSPQLYLLNVESGSKHGHRALVLVAKMLQYLVNNPSHEKGCMMRLLKSFTDINRHRLTMFLNSLCNVDDFYGSLEIHHYMALSKSDRRLHISINELFFMHALVKKYLNVLAPDRGTHLGQIIEELGRSPDQLTRNENYTIDLALFSRWETPKHDLASTLMIENNMTSSDILYIETKTLFVEIMRLTSCRTRPTNLSELARNAARSGIKYLEALGRRASTKLNELEELRILHEDIQKDLMIDEIHTDFTCLSQINGLSKLTEDEKNLNSVLNALKEHHDFLQMQLKTYNDYLKNICQASNTLRGTGANSAFGSWSF